MRRKYTTEEVITAFLDKVNKNGSTPQHCAELGNCWEWTGGVNRKGYGQYRGKRSHRFAWEVYNGKVPDGLFVLHKCDNRKCCNPSHLFLGTHYDNMEDMKSKNRTLRLMGEQNHNYKITNQQILEIRMNYTHIPYMQRVSYLAQKYNVCEEYMKQIIKCKVRRNI